MPMVSFLALRNFYTNIMPDREDSLTAGQLNGAALGVEGEGSQVHWAVEGQGESGGQ